MREIKASDKVTGARRIASIEAARRKVKDGELYFMRRHGAYFRPGAHGYCQDVAAAGLFTAEKARVCLDVNGLSVVPLKHMRETLMGQAAEFSRSMETIKAMLYNPFSLIESP